MNNIVNVSNETTSNWFSKKEICDVCGVGHAAFERFLLILTDEDQKDIQKRPSRNGGNLYSEYILKQFQAWLMRNQANQGKSSEIVKQNTMDNLEIGLVAKACLSSPEAWEQFKVLGDAFVAKDQANQQLQLQNKQLEEENKQMVHTLQYDKVKGWHKWSDLKRDWKPHCEKLKKGRYETIFYEAGLEYGSDYEEITYADCQFPTCMVSPTALPKLMSYLGISIK